MISDVVENFLQKVIFGYIEGCHSSTLPHINAMMYDHI